MIPWARLYWRYYLLSLTEDIRKNLDKGNVGCGIFVDLQKAFDTVEHDIMLAKLEYYGICGITNVLHLASLTENKLFPLMVMYFFFSFFFFLIGIHSMQG